MTERRIAGWGARFCAGGLALLTIGCATETPEDRQAAIDSAFEKSPAAARHEAGLRQPWAVGQWVTVRETMSSGARSLRTLEIAAQVGDAFVLEVDVVGASGTVHSSALLRLPDDPESGEVEVLETCLQIGDGDVMRSTNRQDPRAFAGLFRYRESGGTPEDLATPAGVFLGARRVDEESKGVGWAARTSIWLTAAVPILGYAKVVKVVDRDTRTMSTAEEVLAFGWSGAVAGLDKKPAGAP